LPKIINSGLQNDFDLFAEHSSLPLPLDQDLKPLCHLGKNCWRKDPLHLRSYRHPKDGESEDADKMEEKNEMLDEFQTDEQKLQEAKDHKFAIQLSQDMNDGEDEYDQFCKKPSAAFETNYTAYVSQIFHEAELAECDVFPAPFTLFANQTTPDTKPKLQEAKPKKSALVPDEGSNIIMLMEMSFTRELAIKALEMTDNNIEQAVDWIFDHPGDEHH
jgi:hypothetical protein